MLYIVSKFWYFNSIYKQCYFQWVEIKTGTSGPQMCATTVSNHRQLLVLPHHVLCRTYSLPFSPHRRAWERMGTWNVPLMDSWMRKTLCLWTFTRGFIPSGRIQRPHSYNVSTPGLCRDKLHGSFFLLARSVVSTPLSGNLLHNLVLHERCTFKLCICKINIRFVSVIKRVDMRCRQPTNRWIDAKIQSHPAQHLTYGHVGWPAACFYKSWVLQPAQSHRGFRMWTSRCVHQATSTQPPG